MPEQRRIRTVGRPTYGRPVPARTRSRRKWDFKLGLVPRRLLLLIIATLVVAFVARQLFSVRSIVMNPASTASLAVSAKQVAATSFWTRNVITFDSDSFRSKFMAANPSVKTVQVKRQLPGTIGLTVTLKQPSIGWLSGNEGYVLDVDGTVIGSLPVGSKLPVVLDGSNLPVTNGQTVTTARFISFVTGLAVQIPNTGLIATKYEIRDTTLDLYVTTNKGYQLIFDTSRGAGDEVGDLKLVLNSLKQTGKTPAQYIDLRIAGRAYYK